MKDNTKAMRVAIGVFGVLGIAAIAAWIYQMVSGADISGSGNYAPWGVYIIAFMFCDGIACGSLFLAALPYLLGWKGYDGVSRVAASIGVAFMVITGAFVVIDLGQPLRAFNMLMFGQFGSPLMWDMLSLSALIIVGVAFLVAQRKGNERATKILGAVGIAMALIVTLVMASIFGVMGSHETWGTALLAPWFIASSVASGCAAVLLFSLALGKAGCIEVPDGFESRVGLIMGIAVLADVIMLIVEVGLGVFSGSGASYEVSMAMLSGPLAPAFWIETIACIVVTVMALSGVLSSRPAFAAIAAALTLIAMLCKRFDILEGGYVQSNLPSAVMSTGPQAAVDGTVALAYVPSSFELLVTLGFLCLGVALVLLLSQFFASGKTS